MIHQRPVISRISNASDEDSCTESWQLALKDAFRNPVDLLEYLDLPTTIINQSKFSAIPFPMIVPRGFAQRMVKADTRDPLLLQVLPNLNELKQQPGYTSDPVGDLDSMVIPGLLHKYHGRVLLTLTGACAVHCRYCFRRHFPYSEAAISSSNLMEIIEYITSDDSINEVILSGGDPLSLSDRRLQNIIQHIESINHVDTLRIHTRLPVILPERITSNLINNLTSTRLKVIMVIHCNHANEINDSVEQQLNKLTNNRVCLLNQSVLLRHINDDVMTLVKLSKRLFDLNVTPYYLHYLDKVTGAHHFSVSHTKAKQLYQELQNSLPGYLVPKFVQEITGMNSKVPFI